MKPGYKTTEFGFLAVFTCLQLLGLATGFIKDPVMAGVATSVIGAAYAIARGMAKKEGVKLPDVLPKG